MVMKRPMVAVLTQLLLAIRSWHTRRVRLDGQDKSLDFSTLPEFSVGTPHYPTGALQRYAVPVGPHKRTWGGYSGIVQL
jgi:hypothetical protein